MTTNWTKLAEARGVPQPERFLPSLETLDAVFRPLISTIPFETEPAPLTPIFPE